MNSTVQGCANKSAKQLSKNPLIPWKRLVDINLELMSKVDTASRTIIKSTNNDVHATHCEVEKQQCPLDIHTSNSREHIYAIKNSNKDLQGLKDELMVKKLNEDLTAGGVTLDRSRDTQRQREDGLTEETCRHLDNDPMVNNVGHFKAEKCYTAKKLCHFQTKTELDVDAMKRSAFCEPGLIDTSSTSCDDSSEDDTVDDVIHTEVKLNVSSNQLVSQRSLITKSATNIGDLSMIDDSGFVTRDDTALSMRSALLNAETDVDSEYESEWADMQGDADMRQLHGQRHTAAQHIDTHRLCEKVTLPYGGKHKEPDVASVSEILLTDRLDGTSNSPLNLLPFDSRDTYSEEHGRYSYWANENFQNIPTRMLKCLQVSDVDNTTEDTYLRNLLNNINNRPSRYASPKSLNSLTSSLHFGLNEIEGNRTKSVTLKSVSAGCLNEMCEVKFYDCESVPISDLEDSRSDLSLNENRREIETTPMIRDQKRVANCDVKLMRSGHLVHGNDIGHGSTVHLNKHFHHRNDVEDYEEQSDKQTKQTSEVHQHVKRLTRDPLASWKRLVDANIESLGVKNSGSLCLTETDHARNLTPVQRLSCALESQGVDVLHGYHRIEPYPLCDFDDSAIFTESKSLSTTDSRCSQQSDHVTRNDVVIEDLQFDDTECGLSNHPCISNSSRHKSERSEGWVESKDCCIVDCVNESRSLMVKGNPGVFFPNLSVQTTRAGKIQNPGLGVNPVVDERSTADVQFKNVTIHSENGAAAQHLNTVDVFKPQTHHCALDLGSHCPQLYRVHQETTLKTNGESLVENDHVFCCGQNNILLSAVVENPSTSFHLMPAEVITEGGSSNDVIPTATKLESTKSQLHARRPVRYKTFTKRKNTGCSKSVRIKNNDAHKHDRVKTNRLDSPQDTVTVNFPATNKETTENVDIIGSGWAKLTKYINRVVTLFNASFQSEDEIQQGSITSENYKTDEFYKISDGLSPQYPKATHPHKNVHNFLHISSEDEDTCDDDSYKGCDHFVREKNSQEPKLQKKIRKQFKRRCEEQSRVSGSPEFTDTFGQCFESPRSMVTSLEKCAGRLAQESGRQLKVKVENGGRSGGTREMQKMRTGCDLSDDDVDTSSSVPISKLKQTQRKSAKKSRFNGETWAADNVSEVAAHSDIHSDACFSVTPVCYNTKARRGKAGVTLNTGNAKNETELSVFFSNEKKSGTSTFTPEKSSMKTPTQGTPLHFSAVTPIQGRTPVKTSSFNVQTPPVKLSLLTQTLPAVLQSVHDMRIGDEREDMCSKMLPDRKDENVKAGVDHCAVDEMLRSSLECLLEMLLQRGKVNQAFVSTIQGQVLAQTSGLLITKHDIRTLAIYLTSSYQGVTHITLLTMAYQCFKLDQNSSLIGKAENSIFVARQGKQTIVVGFAHPSSPGSCIREIHELSLALSHRGL
ncbi:hypothetical protein Btru_007861 [Bulinus truncatus]|nr:hypothetical protein Btru_007861 [Bulinus truncatus]